jgi:hypothetical protein
MPVSVGWQFFILDGGSGVVFADEGGQKVGTPTVSVAVMAPPPARMCQWSDMPKAGRITGAALDSPDGPGAAGYRGLRAVVGSGGVSYGRSQRT